MKLFQISFEKRKLSDGGLHIFVQVEIERIMATWIVDTGASHSVLDIGWLKDTFPMKVTEAIEEPAQGIGDAVEVYQTTLDLIILGDLEIQNQPMALIDMKMVNKVYQKEGFEPIQGLMGGDLLNAFHAVIDYKKQKISFSN
jgi:hypothetical protein